MDDSDSDADEPDVAMKKKAHRGAGDGSRRVRCRQCAACLAKDCGKCSACNDKPKFGGKGTLKQGCVRRRCQNMVIAGTAGPARTGTGRKPGRPKGSVSKRARVSESKKGEDKDRCVRASANGKYARLPRKRAQASSAKRSSCGKLGIGHRTRNANHSLPSRRYLLNDMREADWKALGPVDPQHDITALASRAVEAKALGFDENLAFFKGLGVWTLPKSVATVDVAFAEIAEIFMSKIVRPTP
jgi:hypothetical protein